jgi:phosphatidylinositol glycan class A protein
MKKPTLKERLKKYYSAGPIAGLFLLIIVVFDLIFYAILSIIKPASTIDIAIDFPYKKYAENKEKFGDHKFSLLK